METLQKGIVTLIRCGLTGEKLDLPEGFDMETAYTQILRHQIYPICYVGAVNCGIDKKLPAMQWLFQGYVQAMLRSERQKKALAELTAAFESQGIDHLLLKGSVLKNLYPKPELRIMGDADILIRNEQYESLKPILCEHGFAHDSTGPYDYTWDSSELHAEFHYRLASPADKDFLAYFGDGWYRAKKSGEGYRYEYSKEDHLIYLVMHFAKHYRDSGIGIKHAVDLWVYNQAYPKINTDYIKNELEKLHLWEFYSNVQNMLLVWFAEKDEDEKTAFMTDVIFQNGAFGAHSNFVISKSVRAANRSGSSKFALARRTAEMIFPDRESMSLRYPVLKKTPLLLPVMWVARGFRVLLVQPEKIQRQKAEITAATPEKINHYKQALNYVGLDFHFKED